MNINFGTMDTKNAHKNINILLADDDSDDRFFFRIALEEMVLDSELKLVNDGVELMEFLTNAKDDNQLPDIVFLDMNMPRKSGLECLREIRAERRFDTICIVIYSTFGTDQEVDKILAEGANIYFSKPDEMGKIKDMIRQVIRIYRYYPDLGASEEAFFLSL
jgi:CheY-like chemotaxis protein